jgi:hypothetical protein
MPGRISASVVALEHRVIRRKERGDPLTPILRCLKQEGCHAKAIMKNSGECRTNSANERRKCSGTGAQSWSQERVPCRQIGGHHVQFRHNRSVYATIHRCAISNSEVSWRARIGLFWRDRKVSSYTVAPALSSATPWSRWSEISWAFGGGCESSAFISEGKTTMTTPASRALERD